MNEIALRFCELIKAYWTPERIALWKEYEKTDRKISFREFERQAREVHS